MNWLFPNHRKPNVPVNLCPIANRPLRPPSDLLRAFSFQLMPIVLQKDDAGHPHRVALPVFSCDRPHALMSRRLREIFLGRSDRSRATKAAACGRGKKAQAGDANALSPHCSQGRARMPNPSAVPSPIIAPHPRRNGAGHENGVVPYRLIGAVSQHAQDTWKDRGQSHQQWQSHRGVHQGRDEVTKAFPDHERAASAA